MENVTYARSNWRSMSRVPRCAFVSSVVLQLLIHTDRWNRWVHYFQPKTSFLRLQNVQPKATLKSPINDFFSSTTSFLFEKKHYFAFLRSNDFIIFEIYIFLKFNHTILWLLRLCTIFCYKIVSEKTVVDVLNRNAK